MSQITFIFVAFCLAFASSRMAYQLPTDAESILRARSVTESFECAGRPYGYYADVANNCEIFHVCLPIADDAGDIIETAHFSFVCGNQTVFSQETLTCQHEGDSLLCSESESLYSSSNSEFGVVLATRK